MPTDSPLTKNITLTQVLHIKIPTSLKSKIKNGEMKGAADSGRRERERVRGGEVQRQEGGARAGWQGGGSRDRDAGEGDGHGMEGKAVLGERHRGGRQGSGRGHGMEGEPAKFCGRDPGHLHTPTRGSIGEY